MQKKRKRINRFLPRLDLLSQSESDRAQLRPARIIVRLTWRQASKANVRSP